VSITYVESAYEDTLSDTAIQIVDRPCSLLGIIVTPNVNPLGDVVVAFRDGGTSGTVILKTNLGDTSSTNDSMEGVLWSPLPGLGIRVNSSLWVESTNMDSSTPRVKAVTVFYQ